VLGSTAALVCMLWPAGAQLLIRFAGPELWWVLNVAQSAADIPAATVPVPSGTAGVVLISAATVLAALLARLLWRWHWFRAAVGLVLVAVVTCVLAWSLSELLDPRTD